MDYELRNPNFPYRLKAGDNTPAFLCFAISHNSF